MYMYDNSKGMICYSDRLNKHMVGNHTSMKINNDSQGELFSCYFF